MPNGRALPSALLFDWLLGRAWDMGLQNYAQANGIAAPTIGNIAKPDGNYSIRPFASGYSDSAAAMAVAQHDRALSAQLDSVAAMWSMDFEGVMQAIAPVGPGFHNAVDWLRGIVNGEDGLGYVGQGHRVAQARDQAAEVLSSINVRGLPVPPGASAALQQIVAGVTGLYGARLSAQLDADRESERRKLVIDAVDALVKLRNDALDAAMDFVFTQMHLMFDVFGRNNDFLTAVKRNEQAVQARMQIRSSELISWEQSVAQAHDGNQDAQRKAKAVNDRSLEKTQMTVEQHIKRLRRHSSRAAASLNSAGISVNSIASESNNIDAEQA